VIERLIIKYPVPTFAAIIVVPYLLAALADTYL
jgi:hypothetical protein